MRIVSLLPAATEILLALGLEDELVGVTHRCEVPVGIVPPRRVTGDAGLDVAALLDADPDLVLVGDDGAGPNARVARDALDAGDLAADVLTLAPTSVEGIFNAISSVGAMTEAEDEAMDVVEHMRERLREVEEIVVGRKDRGFRPPRVVALDGLAPLRAVGRWVPDQVRLAGGWELLGVEGGPPATTSWQAIGEVDPELLVIMPADLPLDEALEAWRNVVLPAGWSGLRAVAEHRVFVVDGTCFSRPGPRVIDGIEALAELIDPAAFDGTAPPTTWARVD